MSKNVNKTPGQNTHEKTFPPGKFVEKVPYYHTGIVGLSPNHFRVDFSPNESQYISPVKKVACSLFIYKFVVKDYAFHVTLDCSQ